ncbi:hypothetical protein DA89_3539 [Vibrio paracholerae]|nr:hypothetical protein DA89_3539 [Vibrio paracholerae]GHX33793.1 hypothetical protein VCSRO62_1597 [Vibrio cholerae]GHY11486.1 hypothetical protein VCSRO112_2783 [Vibrio cholerae]GHZ43886.1 hypothetical protein VCSRO173_3481 [Vibrio cholerae]
MSFLTLALPTMEKSQGIKAFVKQGQAIIWGFVDKLSSEVNLTDGDGVKGGTVEQMAR